MKSTLKPADRIYRLIGNTIPLSYTIASRNSRAYPLYWYDETNNVNRALRYAKNQKSPFEDEQDGNAILEPIIFENGFLSVPKTNPILQQFLHYHPANGSVFEEVNTEKEASIDVEMLNFEVDALIAARQMTIEQMESVFRVLFNVDPSKLTSSEIKRDILLAAKENPKMFLEVITDPTLDTQSDIQLYFTANLLTFRKNKSEVWFNLPTNKTKMMVVPFGEDPYDAVLRYLQTEEGAAHAEMLETMLKSN